MQLVLSPAKYSPSTAGDTEREPMKDMKPDYDDAKEKQPKDRKQWISLIVFDLVVLIALAIFVWIMIRN